MHSVEGTLERLVDTKAVGTGTGEPFVTATGVWGEWFLSPRKQAPVGVTAWRQSVDSRFLEGGRPHGPSGDVPKLSQLRSLNPCV